MSQKKLKKADSQRENAPSLKAAGARGAEEVEKSETGATGVNPFPIIGIGASAGGLEAFTKLLEQLPANTGMAFVYIQHLAPGMESMLTDILARSTRMAVHKVRNDMPVKPNNVYVIPPGVSMTIVNRVLKLQREIARMPKPVDQFLISLAHDSKNLAIGVVLSGTGSDGTEGLKAIYAEGGITFAQEENSAKYAGMPHSAIASESVHFVLPADKIAEQLVRIGKHPLLYRTELRVFKPQPEEDTYKNILALLKLAFNVNFAAYKESTIGRRISRRMLIHQVEKMEDYVKLLRSDRAALQALFDDLLIGVTSFFREPETFQVLEEEVYPVLLKDRQPDGAIRVWVPGCATGEEVYSLAMSLREYMERTGSSIPIQIFGTDISDKNIERARAGIYPESIAENVTETRLRHFFSKIEQNFQISKSIRDVCVFAKQDLTRDPPFSNLDLISCRNVLIYLKPEAQKRVIPIFHYALKPNAFLILGKSESIGGCEELFAPLDKVPVYLKKMGTARIPFQIEMIEPMNGGRPTLEGKQPTVGAFDGLQKEVERVVLSKFSPPGVVVNNDMQVLLFNGNTSLFLVHHSGEASLDLMRMLKEELRLEVQTAIFLARKHKEPTRREGVQFKHDGTHGQVDLEIVPIVSPLTNERFFLVLFESVEPVAKGQVKPARKDAAGPMIDELKRELASTKETLQTMIEEQEGANEELRAALEEVQSSNEELQSTNEELETAKEELQSTNEELNTVNEELTRRNREITQAHDDLTNLFSNIDLTVIVLDASLTIRLYTPSAERNFSLIKADIGRPISDVRLGIEVQDFESLLKEPIDHFIVKQIEIQDRKGKWYLMRLRPYLTAEKKIDGVVVSFTDIDTLVRNKAEIEKAKKLEDTILTTMAEPLAVLDAAMKLEMANPSFYRTFEIDAPTAREKPISSIVSLPWNAPEYKEAMHRALTNGEAITDLVVDRDFPKIGRKVMALNVRSLSLAGNDPKMILVTFRDITKEKQSQEQLIKNKQELEMLVEERTKKLQEAERLATIGRTAGMVGHDIRNPLQTIISANYLLSQEIATLPENDAKKSMHESIETIDEQISYINKIVSDLQEYSKEIKLHKEGVNIDNMINQILSKARIPKNVKVQTSIDKKLNLKTDPTCITRIFTNLVINAVQAMPDGGKLTINACQEGDKAILTVADTGVGIPEEIKPKLFQPLFTTKSKGQGFGLAVCKRLVEALKGNITFESEKDKGTKFIITLPTK